MFFFGLLSTNLPYILLGMVYLVAFATFSLKALEQEAIDQSEQQAKHIYLEFSNLSENTSNCFQFFDQKNLQAIETASQALIKVLPPLIKAQKLIDPPSFSTQFFPHFLFSRPPPAML